MEIEDNLCFLIQSTEAKINELYSFIEENKKRKEEESFNYKDTIYEESYLLIHVMEASDFSTGFDSQNNYVYVDVQIDDVNSFRTKEMPVVGHRVLWNEPLRMY